MSDLVSLSGALRPFSSRRTDAAAPAGGTVSEILDAVGWGPLLRKTAHVRLFLGDRLLPRPQWDHVIPRPGDILSVRVVPTGGGGGGGGKDVLNIVLTLAIVAASIAIAYLAGPAVAGWLGVTSEAGIGAVSAGVGAVTGIALNTVKSLAMGGARTPSLSGLSYASTNGLTTTSNATSIQGAANTANKYGAVPRIFGRHRVWPYYAARPYTEAVGDDQYLHCAFILGYGPLKLSDHRIGETPLSDYEGVSIEVREGRPGDAPLTLYTNDVYEEQPGVLLSVAAGWVSRTTRMETDAIGWDLTLARLYRVLTEDSPDYDEQRGAGYQVGDRLSTTVQIEAQYRPVGGAWTSYGTITYSSSSLDQIRRGYTVHVQPAGQCEIRFRRLTAEATDGYTYDEVYLTALRSIRHADPINMDVPVCKVALRVKASDQLTGVIDQYNSLAEAYLPVWDGAAWGEQLTRNPSWAYVEVLRGAANLRAVSDDRLDLDIFMAFAQRCDEQGWRYDRVVDTRGTVFERLTEIAATGRASFGMRDSLYSVVMDRPQTAIRQLITPRNSWGFQGSKEFLRPIHAYRVRFINEDAGYDLDEIPAYDDGYDKSNATEFEALDVAGVAGAEQAYKEGRYRLAVRRLRPEVFKRSMDVEHLVANRGDLVLVQDDIPMWGVGVSARVKSVAWGETDDDADDETPRSAVGIVCDDVFPLEGGKSYLIKIRTATAEFCQALAQPTADIETGELAFTAPIPGPVQPAEGDLVSVYESEVGETLCIIAAIDPGPDLSAEITYVEAAPAVHDADKGEIPPFDSKITRPFNVAAVAPPRPAITAVASDETVLTRASDGSLSPRILVRFAWTAGSWVGSANFQAQYRESGGDWQTLAPIDATARSFSVAPVEERQTYDIRLRAVSGAGVASAWRLLAGHTVVGKTSPPPDVPTLLLEGAEAVWSYPAAPPDLAGFKVRYAYGESSTWDAAAPLHDGIITVQRCDVSRLSGTVTILVKAIDTSGNLSAAAARLVKDLGGPWLSNVLERHSQAPAWPGQSTPMWAGDAAAAMWADNAAAAMWDISRGVIEDEALLAQEVSSMWTGDAAAMWSHDNAALWSPAYAALAYTWSWTPEATEVGEDAVLAYDTDGPVRALQYRPPTTARMWSDADGAPMWSDDAALSLWAPLPVFSAWPGRVALAGVEPIAFRIDIAGGSTRGAIRQLDVIVDAEDVEESLEDVEISTAGARLALTKTYRKIKIVLLTLQDNGLGATRVDVVDKSVRGPLLRAVGATALCDVHIQGY